MASQNLYEIEKMTNEKVSQDQDELSAYSDLLAQVEDLIAAAVNDAVRKLEEKNKETLGSMTGGMNLPAGFKLPF